MTDPESQNLAGEEGMTPVEVPSPRRVPERIGPRVELKFVVPHEQADAALRLCRQDMQADPHAKSPDDAAYLVESLYFDTPELDCFRRRGADSLSKYRLRRYDGDDGTMFLEEKLRRENSVWKRRLRASLEEIRAIVLGTKTLGAEAEWFRHRFRVLDLRPQLLVSYRREALVGERGERLTIDRSIHGLRPAPISDPAAWHPFGTTGEQVDILEPGMAVLEVKHVGQAETFEATVAGALGLPAGACSKYARGIVAAGMNT